MLAIAIIVVALWLLGLLTSTTAGDHYRGDPDPPHPGLTTRKPAGNAMNALKMTALALMVGGVLALAYSGFSLTRETKASHVKLEPIELSVKGRKP